MYCVHAVHPPYALKTEGDEEKGETGNKEWTVVLCMEAKNSGDPGPSVGFVVERVNVNVGREGTSVVLIGWDVMGRIGRGGGCSLCCFILAEPQ